MRWRSCLKRNHGASLLPPPPEERGSADDVPRHAPVTCHQDQTRFWVRLHQARWNTPPHTETISKRFAKDVKNSGVRRIRLHDLRHTFATTALAAGENPKAISEALGHKNIEITLTTHSHLLPGIHAQTVANGRIIALQGIRGRT
ncbi:tyrosine-type recombinase/integrase [bacterium]|nr:tyrosine-type recombinase/integrase [bacterium]